MNADIKELTSEIRDLVTQMKNVEADVSIVKNVNEKLVNQLIETERQSWANAQYSSRESLEVVRIPAPIPNDLSEANVFKVFDKLGVHFNRKDSLQIFRVKEDLKYWIRLN